MRSGEQEAQRQRELEQANKLAKEQQFAAKEGEKAASSLRKRLILATVAVGIAVIAFAAATGFGVDANKQRNTAQTASTAAVNERNKAEIAAVTATVAQGQAEIEAKNAVEAKATAEANAAEAKRQALISRSGQLAVQSSVELSNSQYEPAMLLAVDLESQLILWRPSTPSAPLSPLRAAAAKCCTATRIVSIRRRGARINQILTSSGTTPPASGMPPPAPNWSRSRHTEVSRRRGARMKAKILTSSDDGTARIWDAASGAELVTLAGHTVLSLRRRGARMNRKSSPAATTTPPASGMPAAAPNWSSSPATR